MPVYEYLCESCDTLNELVKPMSEMEREETCEVCSGVMVRQISRSDFHLKGKGWYKTDYTVHGGAHMDRGPKGRGNK